MSDSGAATKAEASPRRLGKREREAARTAPTNPNAPKRMRGFDSTESVQALKKQNVFNKKGYVRRAIENKAPKLVENCKRSLVLKGRKTSEVVNALLTDIHLLKKPDSVHFQHANDVQPLLDPLKLEFLCQKNDCSLFALGTHSKKRPHCLTLGRLYDAHMLDIVELGIQAGSFESITSIKGPKAAVGSKPAFVFIGDDFENKDEWKELRNLIVDFFRGHVVSKLYLEGLDHVFVCTAHNGVLLFRSFAISLTGGDGDHAPSAQLVSMGPNFNAKLNRHSFAPADVRKRALVVPKGLRPKKIKNITTSGLGERVGQIHMARQNFDKISLKKPKGAGKKRARDSSATNEDGDGDATGGISDNASEAKRARTEQ